jgi:hypothetical protein
VTDEATRHEEAARRHDAAAQRHEAAALFWTERGDAERADLERRNAEIERAAATLEVDRARVARERPLSG